LTGPGFPELAGAVCRRTWVKTLRRPVTLTFSLVQPLVWMTFFGFLFHRYRVGEGVGELGGGSGTPYLDFLAPGVCTMTVLFGASQSGIGWIRDLQTGFLPRILNTPASHHPILAGKVLADGVRLLLQASAILAAALLLGVRPAAPSPSLLPGILAVALFAAAFSALSCAVALRARAPEAMATYVHLINMPLLFTSTALVPGRQMPPWLEAISAWNPLSLAVDAFRGALLAGQTPSLPGQLLPLALLTAATYLLAAREMEGIGRLY